MKLIALKPIYFGGIVIVEGQQLKTLEQHGRELIAKGYAQLADDGNSPKPEPTDAKADKKAKK